MKQLTEAVRKFAQERDWEKFHNPKDLAIALVLEANEVLEHFRFKKIDEAISQAEIAKEIADVFIYVLRLSDVLEIDLIYWFEAKMKENATKYPVSTFYGSNKKYNEV
jgi:dCTP diphosphatase